MNDCPSTPIARSLDGDVSVSQSLAHHRFSSTNKVFDVFHQNVDDHIFRQICRRNEFYEIELLRALSKLLREGDLVLDVGANIGNHALFFAGVVGCRVACFEPNPEAMKLLQHNIHANGLGDLIDVFPTAIGAEVGCFSADISLTQNNLGAFRIRPAAGGSIHAVPLDKVDIDGAVKLMKIDVEGMELDVILGAREIILRDRPLICVECDDISRFHDIFDLLSEFKYIVTESYNYTATHIFAPSETASWKDIASLSRNLAAQYIFYSHEISELQRKLRSIADAQNATKRIYQDLFEKIEGLEKRVSSSDKSEVSKIDELRKEIRAWTKVEINAASIGAINKNENSSESLGSQFQDIRSEIIELRASVNSLKQAQVDRTSKTFGQKLVREVVRPLRGDHRRRLYSKVRREISRPLKFEHWRRIVSKVHREASRPFDKMNGRIAFVAKSTQLLKRLRSLQAIAGFSARLPTVEAVSIPPVYARSRTDGWTTSLPGEKTNINIGEFEVPKGGLIRVKIEANMEGLPSLALTLLGGNNRAIGPEHAIRKGENEILAFAPLQTSTIYARLTVQNSIDSAKWCVNSIALEILDSDGFFRLQKAKGLPDTFASLASIPSRQDMLADCVASLLHQADKVRVFLNGYEAVPDFLKHERIEVRRSQDWDDRGDAGKLFWLDAIEEEGYRLVVDDDLIFPPDFTRVMTAQVTKHGDSAIIGVHGVLIRQPLILYHEPASRARTFHFAYALAKERTVHILGTNALCFHSSAVKMRWADCLYCNSADIWLAIYAQQHRIPMITPARPQNWVCENITDVPTEKIFDHSLKQTGSRFDSSLVQNAALTRAQPLTLQRCMRPKLCMIVLTRDAVALNNFADKWKKTLCFDYDWVLVVKPTNSCQIVAKAAHELAVEHEIHVLPVCEDIVSALKEAASFAHEIATDYVFAAQDYLSFEEAGWDSNTIRALSRYSNASGFFAASVATDDRTIPCVSYHAKHITKYGFPHGFAELAAPFLTADASSADISAARLSRQAVKKAKWIQCPDAAKPSSHSEIERNVKQHSTLNDLFERVVYINLDRRTDRRAAIEAELNFHGVVAERFSALDGGDSDIQIEYEAYLKQPLRTVSEDVRSLRYETDFYLHYDSQASRTAMLEQTRAGKAIRSAGAWAYLKGWEQILERAIRDGVETLLVFDDDVLLHRDTKNIFQTVVQELPANWLVLQLGTLQYNWDAPWTSWRSSTLYSSCGAIGSHAVGLRFEAMVYLLDRIKMRELPLDIGALSAITRDFSDRCFVSFPNLAIQSLTDTDIGTSEFQKNRSIDEMAEVYRWTIKDYGITQQLPQYVLDVQRETANARLAKIKNKSLQSTSAPTLVCVLKNERLTIQTFMQHYRSGGIQHFIFIDNGSTDGTVEFLGQQADVDLYQVSGPFDWRRKQGWINRVIDEVIPEGSWILYADADELMVFDGIETRSFGDLTQKMDLYGIKRCRGMLIDMYCAGPILRSTYSEGQSLVMAYPYFDQGTYSQARYREIISRKGGPRRRAFGHVDMSFNPELTKYPLFKMSRGELFANPHHIWPYTENFVSDCYIGILHFKFLPDSMEHIKAAVRDKSYWNDSIEYRCYLSALERDSELTLYNEASRRFSESKSLIEADLISQIAWSD